MAGVALTVNPDFKIFASAYPYVVSRLLSDNSSSTREVLHSVSSELVQLAVLFLMDCNC